MRTLLLLLTLSVTPAWSDAVSGPVPGYVLDSRTGTLRPVLGIPGAMQLGSRVPLPFTVASVEFAPGANLAAVISNETPAHFYVIQNLSNPTINDLGPVADGSIVLAINRTGQTAVLTAQGQLQFVTGLTRLPVLANAIPTRGLLGAISAGAVDDAGKCALLGTAADSTGSLQTFCSDGSSQTLLSQAGLRIAAIGLANSGQDAILADSAGQQILRVAGYTQPGAITALATANDGISTPVAMQVNGERLMVADSAASVLFFIDLSGQAPIQSSQLNSPPSRLKFLADTTVLVLNDASTAPFTVFDLQTMQPFFIPTN